MNYLDNLPIELIFILISYLNSRSDVNKLIYTSGKLINTFKYDKTWQNMTHQNVPDFKFFNEYTVMLWQDIYFEETVPELRHQFNAVDTRFADYIIFRYHIGLNPSEYNQLYIIQDRLRAWKSTEVSFITKFDTHHNFQIKYINEKHRDIFNKLVQLNLVDMNNVIGIFSLNSNINVNNIRYIFSSLSDTKLYNISTLMIGDYKILHFN
jgi:hypothetical protein